MAAARRSRGRPPFLSEPFETTSGSIDGRQVLSDFEEVDLRSQEVQQQIVTQGQANHAADRRAGQGAQHAASPAGGQRSAASTARRKRRMNSGSPNDNRVAAASSTAGNSSRVCVSVSAGSVSKSTSSSSNSVLAVAAERQRRIQFRRSRHCRAVAAHSADRTTDRAVWLPVPRAAASFRTA